MRSFGLGLFLTISVVSFVVLWFLWVLVIVSSGGSLDECDRGYCGALGEWSYAHGIIVNAVIAAVALLAAYFVAKNAARRRA